MSKKTSTKASKNSPVPGYAFVAEADGVEEYLLKSNGLRVLYLRRPNTGVVTTNITYLVGARDEQRGETGMAHMLEHMLFKPTKDDLEKGIEAGSAVHFEQNSGCNLNANTWKDRTTYYFSYPTPLMEEAIMIEAERMGGVVLTDETLKPEQGNVLSEFDMYNGDPNFALAVQMCSTAFLSHPYGHETIGYREDIADFTAAKLEKFYRDYYRPDNAIMMIIGDVDKVRALIAVKNSFEKIKNPDTPIPRFSIREPKQEGLRRFEIERESSINIISIGFKHAGFPTEDWFVTNIMLYVLTSGPESILHRLLIDTGKASGLDVLIEPCSEESIAAININLAPGQSHTEIEKLALNAIQSLTSSVLAPLVKKAKAHVLTEELFARDHSTRIAMELTEYVSAGNWEAYGKTTKLLEAVTTKKIISNLATRFAGNNLTIGHFIGK